MMETIREYLENMFRNLPDTPEVRRAKEELWQMMEDKYTELLAEGMSENEAVGTVMTEFGNLDELSGILGISFTPAAKTAPQKKAADNEFNAGQYAEEMRQKRAAQGAGQFRYGPAPGPYMQRNTGMPLYDQINGNGIDEIKTYLEGLRKSRTALSIGVALCIISVCGPILADTFESAFFGIFYSIMDRLGAAVLFLAVAAGIGFFVYASRLRKQAESSLRRPWFLKNEAADFTADFIKEEHSRLSTMRWLGIALCGLSVVPVILFGGFYLSFFDTLGTVLMFAMIAAGVMLILYTSYLHPAKKLLKMNARMTGYVAGYSPRMR